MTAILTVTMNPCVDKNTSLPRVAPERKLRCKSPRFEPGGGGVNVSRALKELGEPSLALWTKGGPTGRRLEQLLDEAKLCHRPTAIADETRENLIVYEEETSDQYRFGMPGPELSDEEARRLLESVRSVEGPIDFVVLSGSLPKGVGPGFFAELIQAVPSGAKVVLDTSGEPLRLGLEAGVFMVKPNLSELGQLAGSELASDADVERAAKRLVADGQAELVLTSLGAGGAFLVTAGATSLIRSPTVPIRSKVGAGDCMVAGMVLGLHRHGTLYEAVCLAVAAGAAAVMTEGTELCRREDVERLFQSLRTEYPSVYPQSPHARSAPGARV